MNIVGLLIVKYGSKIVAGAAILLIRYLEKTKVIKHYKKKIDNILEYGKD